MRDYLFPGADFSHLEQSLGAVHVPDLPPADIHALSRMLEEDRDVRSGFVVLHANSSSTVVNWKLEENCFPRLSERQKIEL